MSLNLKGSFGYLNKLKHYSQYILGFNIFNFIFNIQTRPAPAMLMFILKKGYGYFFLFFFY